MATLVLGAVGSAVGAGFGGAILGLSGATIGGMIGSAVGSVVDSWIIGSLQPDQRYEGARLESLRVTSSTEGAVLPRAFGRMRIGGNVIWATDFTEHVSTTTQGGGKGGGPTITTTEYSYSASFAIALCEGPITGIGRIWADAEPLDLTGVTWRWYPGDEAQLPDPFIEAKMGAGQTPAYRGTAYVVFEELDLTPFGNRIPQLTFEVFRPLADPDTAEGLCRAVTMIPASGEFAYATAPIRKVLGEGEEVAENQNGSSVNTDIVESLDRLEALAPAVESVSLVVSWFGNDLRAGECEIMPGVELAAKTTTPQEWSVNGISRAEAHVVSTGDEGRPVYGGTPADFAVVQAIRELKARGYRVTFYPFILMDIPPGNALADPYSDGAGATGQPAYPWRGRITCSPAAGYAGTVDKTATATWQVSAFFGEATPADFAVSGESVSYTGLSGDWGLRRMILHYAHLCAAAGGVDAFLIGSELRGLTTIRGSATTYPAVAELRSLAADVRAILGPSTAISYAADWSEYFGHDPGDGSGDRFFHLDPLWADANIDFVGIDNYMPISDWRDGFEHADAVAGAPTVYDRAYLQSNIAGGEGFDWFYASQADREAQLRSPISDSAYGEDWIWRFKDLRSWWSEPHHDRPAGMRLGIASQGADPIGWNPIGTGVTLTAGSGSHRGFTAPALIASGGATWHGATPGFFSFAPGERVAISAYVSAGSSGKAMLDFAASGAGDTGVVVNLATGSIESWFAGPNPMVSKALVDLGGGVWRIDMVVDVTIAATNYQLRLGPRSAMVGEDVLAFGIEAVIEGRSSTDWVVESKPIRFTELGCPAVDRGTNQPNVFVDPKSSESALPYFSRGWRDDAIQRAYLEASWLYWGDPSNNPASGVYGAPMVEVAECAAWTWDARPYPFFPALTDVWADGDNWRLGHWLTGRLGAVSLAALVRHLCLRAGLAEERIDVSGLWGAVEGYVITALESPRTSISMLARHFGFDAVESEGVIRFRMRAQAPVATLSEDDLVAAREGEAFEILRAQETELPQALKWRVARADGDYDAALVEARRITVDSARIGSESFPVAVVPEEAERRCRRALMEAWTGRDGVSFRLPPSRLALEPSDPVAFTAGGHARDLRIVSTADAEARGIEAVAVDREAYDLPPGPARQSAVATPAVFGAPAMRILDLPQLREDIPAHRPWVVADASPWPGEMAVFRSLTLDGWTLNRTVTRRARLGRLGSDLYAGPTSRFDHGNEVILDLAYGSLASVSDLELFAGANALAVESAADVWEILQAGTAELQAPGRYRLTRLLRGQRGTEWAMGNPAPAGARVVVLDQALFPLEVSEAEIGTAFNWRIGPSVRPVDDASYAALAFTPAGVGLRPFAPVHVEQPWRRGRVPGDFAIRWVRRSRALSADSWEGLDVPLLEEAEAWEVEILDGTTVKRVLSSSTTSVLYAEAGQVADWGAPLGPGDSLDIRIHQLSQAVGRGTPAAVTLWF
ncbi:Putative phage tail protein [Meinhardsimonia xiamenensis]|uniref:Putative phage tail protein n=1 Tax=Meinhardsimonia xiamenensis TaxID=990712 RepID=A0A1G9GTI4_9RHOB|nr:glycoside hydrolase TIM-barrel-like domain-containing protein [Meinhardsimonia xiamenensis]SDL03948.1 Putative phage tail protein [Meinhardsimonia xiamenensis]